MARSEVLYACTHCDAQYPKWQGQCAECGKWGTVKEAEEGAAAASGEVVSIASSAAVSRIPTGLREVDAVLGGGLVPGSLVLLGGDPGIGKSTLVLHMASGIALRAGGSVLYVCGEESPEQIGMRMARMGVRPAPFKFLSSTDVRTAVGALALHRPNLAIVDSVQTLSEGALEGAPGSIAQIRAVTSQLLEAAKRTGVPVILIGHVTKDGAVAGPKALEHLVDAVLYLEGDSTHQYRLLRGTKNRFGPTNQVGVFSMEERGLVEVANPSELFLHQGSRPLPGSVVSVVMEGNRPFLIELQALTNKTNYGYPKRAASGFDVNRLELILAVLSRRGGLHLDNQDVFVNIVGGLRVKDPALDLAAALAVASSLSNQTMPEKSVVLGELGLGGEVRSVARLEDRLREARRLGFERAYAPGSDSNTSDIAKALAILGIAK
ncbi:MAG: DNA repair protein RadA [Parcubacteria group bacterium]|nr:DNA repair protein RadA [Parcubacteria group bacterium]